MLFGGVTVKDVDAHEFVKAFATRQKSTCLGSTIKYDHSNSVIAYYTRWYAVYSVPTSHLRYPYIT